MMLSGMQCDRRKRSQTIGRGRNVEHLRVASSVRVMIHPPLCTWALRPFLPNSTRPRSFGQRNPLTCKRSLKQWLPKRWWLDPFEKDLVAIAVNSELSSTGPLFGATVAKSVSQ